MYSKIFDLLTEMQDNFDSQQVVLDMDGASKLTGLSKSTLYHNTSTNEIPHYKPRGKKIYFKREELIAWLLRNKVVSANEEKTEAMNHLTLKKEGDKNENR